MDPLTIIDLVLRYGPTVVSLVTQASSNDDLVTKIQKLSKPLADLLETIGSNLFPKAAPALHLVGGVLRTFSRDLVIWLQTALNSFVTPSPALVVDGIYGPLTRAAVEALQKQLGLTIDGVAGAATQAAIQVLQAKKAGMNLPDTALEVAPNAP